MNLHNKHVKFLVDDEHGTYLQDNGMTIYSHR